MGVTGLVRPILMMFVFYLSFLLCWPLPPASLPQLLAVTCEPAGSHRYDTIGRVSPVSPTKIPFLTKKFFSSPIYIDSSSYPA